MSEQTVFYAWQSDLDGKINHYFIRDAAKAALKSLSKEAAVDEAARLDHDTAGVPGSPDIAGTIFSKIDACAVFLADLTFVASSEPKGNGEPGRLVPNPNVLIELGYALKSVGDERVIMVMNTAFGRLEDLPFDLRNRRFPVTYDLPFPEAPNRKEVQRQLERDLKRAISAVLRSPALSAREAERAQAVVQRIAEERRVFELAALSGQFYKFAPKQGALLVGVVPEYPQTPPLNFGDPRVRQVNLQPIAGYPTKTIRGARARATTMTEHCAEVPYSVAELRGDGCVLFADGSMLYGGVSPELQERYGSALRGFVPHLIFEGALVRTVKQAMTVLRNLEVRGPHHVVISMHRIRGFMMGLETYALALGHDIQTFDRDGISPDPVKITDADDISTERAVARVLKPAFDHIWQEFGFEGSRNFDAQGEWIERPLFGH